jgi:hypothetical protein
VVVRRVLRTEDAANDVQFERGKLIPIAFHAWDGANSEFGLRMAVSSWYFLALETPAPVTVYLYAPGAGGGRGGRGMGHPCGQAIQTA